jgi:cyanate permease
MWFPPDELAKANGICISSMGIGGAIAMATAAGFMSPAFGGWRGTVVVLASFSLAMGILWVLLYRDKKADTGAESKQLNVLDNFKKVFKVRDIWLIAVFYGLNMIGLMAIITLLPVVLEERGVPRPGQLVSIMMVTSVVFNILGGIVSDKVGKRKPFLAICAFVFGICILTFATFTGVPLVITLVISGAAIGTIAPVMMTIPVEMKQVGTLLAGTAVGFIFMIGNTGGFIGPVVSGKLMDLTGSLWPGFIFMAAALIFAAVVIVPLQETGRKEKPKGNHSSH